MKKNKKKGDGGKKLREMFAKEVCVNLGCGTHIIPGWINVDNSIGFDSKDFKAGDARAIPLESNSVNYLLCDNVLEHIPMSDVPVVLFEIRRVLKVGGRAIIIVPDFKNAAESWLKANEDQQGFNPFTYLYTSEVVYGNQLHEGEYHKTPMSPGFLNFAIKMAGFRQVRMVMHPQFGDAPEYPGVRSAGKTLRQGEIVCDIIKTT